VQSSTSYSTQILVGYVGDSVEANFSRQWYISGASAGAYEFGIGIDTVTNFSGSEGGTTADANATTSIGYAGTTKLTIPPFFGTHTLYGIERLSYNPSATMSAFENLSNTGLYTSTKY
jgi:hypothetical protein